MISLVKQQLDSDKADDPLKREFKLECVTGCNSRQRGVFVFFASQGRRIGGRSRSKKGETIRKEEEDAGNVESLTQEEL